MAQNLSMLQSSHLFGDEGQLLCIMLHLLPLKKLLSLTSSWQWPIQDLTWSMIISILSNVPLHLDVPVATQHQLLWLRLPFFWTFFTVNLMDWQSRDIIIGPHILQDLLLQYSGWFLYLTRVLLWEFILLIKSCLVICVECGVVFFFILLLEIGWFYTLKRSWLNKTQMLIQKLSQSLDKMGVVLN